MHACCKIDFTLFFSNQQETIRLQMAAESSVEYTLLSDTAVKTEMTPNIDENGDEIILEAECNSGGKPTSTILMAIMNLIMGSVLMSNTCSNFEGSVVTLFNLSFCRMRIILCPDLELDYIIQTCMVYLNCEY